MSDEFKREDRYMVFKISDVVEHCTKAEALHLARLYEIQRVGRKDAGKAELECVVVESDWPEYEPTWKAIEARVTGAQPAPSEGSITAGILSGMFLSLDGHDKAQPGYEWRKGWNDAIRQAMDYAQPAPSVPVDVITDYLVSISAHIAHQDDTKAQAEIGELLKLLAAAAAGG